MTTTTCQICGREIKTTKGNLIAHHGYKRPGIGWQSSSCPGARGLPYEVSRDLIPPFLAEVEAKLELLQKRREELLWLPPATLRTNTGSVSYPAWREIERPADFDGVGSRDFNHELKWCAYRSRATKRGTYEHAHAAALRATHDDLSRHYRVRDDLKRRHLKWVAPAELEVVAD